MSDTVKNGTTDRCAQEGCPIIVRFKNPYGWRHSIVGKYDHDPVPTNHADAKTGAAMPADQALANIFAAVKV